MSAQLLNKENGFQVNLKGGEAAAALPGTYKVTRVQLSTAASGAPAGRAKTPPKIMLYGGGTSEVVLKPGENKLTFGLPLKLDFKAVRTAKGISVKEVNLVGAAGEGYRAYNYGARKSCKLVTSLRAGSQTAPGAKLSYG